MPEVFTLPKELVKKGELVVMPRSEYERLLDIVKKQVEFDEGLQQSLKEARQGKVIGPFDNAKDLIKSLASES